MTIKRRIRIALSLMVILPALLMGLVFGLANRLNGPGEGIDPRGGPFFSSSSFRHDRMNGTHLPFAAIIALLVFCNGFLSWWAASAIVRPLARLRDSALRVGEGDLDFRIEGSGDDELGEVAQAFETMRAKLFASLQKQLAEENARRELVAHVSHDLRTPVAIIRGHAEGLRDGVASTPAMRERYLAAILDRSRELESLIELLFAYSRLELDQRPKRPGQLPLRPYLESLRESLAQSFPTAKLRLEPSPAETGPAETGESGETVAADPELTRRAVTNLVENAVKHCGAPEVTIEWRLRCLPDRVELAVADDGEGVAEEDLGRLFEPFFRGDRARGHGGSGLGLAIVRKILESQGGSVRAARSRLGGLEVTLSFPRTEIDGQTNPDHRG